MSDYEQRSGTTVDVGLDNFEYEQRSGSTVDIELDLSVLLEAVASDTDNATTTVIRIRALSATASDTDTSLTSATRLRNLKTTSADTDISVSALERLRNVSARASDLSDATAQLSRLRNLSSMATDTDSASGLLARVRTLTASASDPNEATAILPPSSVATDPRQMAIDILRNVGQWPTAKPEVFKADAVTQKGRENNAHPAIYVQHVDESLTRPSDGEQNLKEDTTVRLDVWVLGDSNHDGQAIAREYRNRVINVFNNYMNDNYARTEFHRVEPSDSTDFRQQHIARQTDHHIYSVEIETHRLAGVL